MYQNFSLLGLYLLRFYNKPKFKKIGYLLLKPVIKNLLKLIYITYNYI